MCNENSEVKYQEAIKEFNRVELPDDTDIFEGDYKPLPAYMLKFLKVRKLKCPVCGKVFAPAPRHVYKHRVTKNLVCTWGCVMTSEREYEAQKEARRQRSAERRKQKLSSS